MAYANLAALMAQQQLPNGAMPGVGLVQPGALAQMALQIRQRGLPGQMPQAGGGLPFGRPGANPFAAPQMGSPILNSLGSLQAALPYGR